MRGVSQDAKQREGRCNTHPRSIDAALEGVTDRPAILVTNSKIRHFQNGARYGEISL